MKEIDFKDRVPNYPGRVTLTPVSGQPDTFDMTRADEPVVEGTPINKVLFQSITHSRLTGRFYSLSVSRSAESEEQTYTLPLQNLNWTVNSAGTVATSGDYQVSAANANGSCPVQNAIDGNDVTYWRPATVASGNVYSIMLAKPFTVRKMKLAWNTDGTGVCPVVVIQGSLDNEQWQTLYEAESGKASENAEYTLTSTGKYRYYRVDFQSTSNFCVRLYNIEIMDRYTAYTNAFTASNVPLTWESGQRISVQAPDMAIYPVTGNTFMGIKCNTILQPSKRYELVYNGSSFDAVEV